MSDASVEQVTVRDFLAISFHRHHDLVALEVGGESFTYGQLWTWAGALAQRVGSAGKSARVGLYAARTPAAYAGYLAAIRLGATVVPINPGFPADRNRAVLARAGLDAVLTDREIPDGIADGAPAWIDATDATAEPIAAFQVPEQVAYLLFTSGSTGAPKGVPVLQTNVCAYLDHVVGSFGLGPGARCTQNFDLTFDPSVTDLLGTWAGGGTLVVASERQLLAPTRFVDEYAITHWFSVPSVVSYAQRVGLLKPAAMPGLQWSAFIGEPLTLQQAEHWSRAAPNSRICNVYGPTELTVSCTEYLLPQDRAAWPVTSNGTVPIGEPHQAMEAALTGEGELCFRGSQRFDGYLDPADNEGRFLTAELAPSSGCHEVAPTDWWYRTGDKVRREPAGLVHLGRLDRQVKVSGYRVDLGDVEYGVRSVPGVLDAAVIQDPDGSLTCYLVANGIADDEPLRAELRRTLPAYMVPARIEVVGSLPLNSSGKIDYQALTRQTTA